MVSGDNASADFPVVLFPRSSFGILPEESSKLPGLSSSSFSKPRLPEINVLSPLLSPRTERSALLGRTGLVFGRNGDELDKTPSPFARMVRMASLRLSRMTRRSWRIFSHSTMEGKGREMQERTTGDEEPTPLCQVLGLLNQLPPPCASLELIESILFNQCFAVPELR